MTAETVIAPPFGDRERPSWSDLRSMLDPVPAPDSAVTFTGGRLSLDALATHRSTSLLGGPIHRRQVTARDPGLMLPEALEADAMPFTPDPCMAWIRAHGAELVRHEGRYVLVHATRGIVNASDDPGELERFGGDDDDLLIHFVRPGFHAPAAP